MFAAGAVECGDRGRFVEVLVDRRDELGRQVCDCGWIPGQGNRSLWAGHCGSLLRLNS